MNMDDASRQPTTRWWNMPVALVVAGALLATAIGVGLVSVGRGFAARAGDEITVTGSARAAITSDRAVWTISANHQADAIADAVRQTNDSLDQVSRFLVAGGIDEGDISLDALSTSVNYTWVDGTYTSEIASYGAYRNLTVRSDDVDLIDQLSTDLGQVLETGIVVSAFPPQYYVTMLPDLRPQLLEEAVADALVRAESMLDVVDGSVAGVRSMRAGPFQVSAPDSVDVSDFGLYDTSTIDKTVTATVTVTFATR